MPPKKPLRCGACKAVIYCNKECSKHDWKYGTGLRFSTHKQLCPDNKRHMLRLPETQAILTSFPWGRLETDGTFNNSIARGRFDVLGGSGFGFWSHRGGPIPHQNMGELRKALAEGSPYSAMLKSELGKFDHLDGKDLLSTKHLTDSEGWKLPDRLIPYRDFASVGKKPQLVEREIDGWDAWHEWRKLPRESPAALLMSFPLSAYWLIVHCLEVTGPSAGSTGKRVPLLIHAIGAEVELNYLPLFSEIALLLPYHDIKLLLFGQSVEKLVSEAKKSHPQSLVAKSSSSSPVFAYKAPKECGSGSIEIFLHGDSPTSSPDIVDSRRPDAIIAFNAGLGSYKEWIPVVQTAHLLSLPFAVTKYAELSCEQQRSMFPRMLLGFRVPARREYAIDLNPFQTPGQRGIPMYRLPNVVNGFTLVVWKSDGDIEAGSELGVVGQEPEALANTGY
ncbi:uncharacterized protein BT62DRAFT_959913 [Guyanagaster necrorhizus]|uniref:MYND-type domain-containing protein n=1 Tax=Guyanagaster necrorhizus TaxID=856835 RepID=A0A9P7W4F9_9AGAR|nr:uncharacterized protein BT62DRAFT_959913 [Guyanagaster necrorhizus MCA 3950]KAG7451973.1 hypothetical protein BT62DRAFT_959913 [Guyanagaster necrorhizus MCA 3950]